MKSINYVGFLSLLALLAILGLTMHEPGLIGFLGFLYFIRYFGVEPSLAFKHILQKAGCYAFLTELFCFLPLFFIAFFTLPFDLALTVALGISFIAAIATFTFSLVYFELKYLS